MNNYEKLYTLIFSDKCKVMLDDPMSLIPECKNDKNMVNFIEVQKKVMKSYFKYSCILNGDGKLCPINEQLFIDQGVFLSTESEECNYKSCYDSYKQFIEDSDNQEVYEISKLIYVPENDRSSEFNELYKDLFNDTSSDSYNDLSRGTTMGILDSKNCTSRIKDDTFKAKIIGFGDYNINGDNKDENSGVSSTKTMNSLIILFIVFILFLKY